MSEQLTRRQCEAHVQRMVPEGKTQDEILSFLLESGWDESEARRLIQTTASHARWKFGGIAAGCAAAAIAGVAMLLYVGAEGDLDEDVMGLGIGLGLFGVPGFFYGLAKLMKVRA